MPILSDFLAGKISRENRVLHAKDLDIFTLKEDLRVVGVNVFPDVDTFYMIVEIDGAKRVCKSLDLQSWDSNRLVEIITCYGCKNFAYWSMSGTVDSNFKFFVW